MGTLLLRLAAPLQSWGEESKFETRRTRREPTKSGVIGLLAAALGRRRDEPLDDLRSLRFAVRVDQEGELLRDYHTARNEKTAYVTERYYLADAVFLVGLESSDEEFLSKLDAALCAPAFSLFLGRRSCPPTPPLSLGIVQEPLAEALKNAPWQISEWRQAYEWRRRFGDTGTATLRTLFDASYDNDGAVRSKDLPVSFNSNRRQYAYRACAEHLLPLKKLEPHDAQDTSKT